MPTVQGPPRWNHKSIDSCNITAGRDFKAVTCPQPIPSLHVRPQRPQQGSDCFKVSRLSSEPEVPDSNLYFLGRSGFADQELAAPGITETTVYSQDCLPARFLGLGACSLGAKPEERKLENREGGERGQCAHLSNLYRTSLTCQTLPGKPSGVSHGPGLPGGGGGQADTGPTALLRVEVLGQQFEQSAVGAQSRGQFILPGQGRGSFIQEVTCD